MPEPSETSGHPLATTPIKQEQPDRSTINSSSSSSSSSTRTKQSKSSQPTDDCCKDTKTTIPRRRPESALTSLSGPHAGSSRTEQRSASSTTKMSSRLPSVHYTRTGRISKAKKGLKVHNCECGRSYTRAEHLRRHQKNHAQDDALMCSVPDCGKSFYRLDLLHRHQERHNEVGKESRQPSILSPGGSPVAPQTALLGAGAMSIATTTMPQTDSYHSTLPLSPVHETGAVPRYTFTAFRTPEIPQFLRTPHVSCSGPRSFPHSSPTSSPNNKPRDSLISRQPAPVGVAIEAATSSMSWNEAYSQSPGYSSSSGYASPIPGPGEYNNVFAIHPYGHGSNRTRTSSNASFIEPWSYTPRSPTSSNSTMPYTWASSERAVASLAFLGSSYSMTSLGIPSSVDSMSSFGHFGPKTMMQRDEEEGVILFPEEPYGMGQIAHTYPLEQFLNNYWRLFHPTFPIVHRPTFESMRKSPMLHAAMIAIGGQYSNDLTAKRRSRVLHDRCIKLLEKRDQEAMAEDERMCDYQAIFLIETLSQYRARRAAKTLSPRFGTVYHKACDHFRRRASQLTDIILGLTQPEDATLARWLKWTELMTWQHLLIACYILESQQAVLLAREPHSSIFPEMGFDMPIPAHPLLWSARDVQNWASAAQDHGHSPQDVFELTKDVVRMPYTSFQSALVIAASYNHFGSTKPYVDSLPVLDATHLVDGSLATQYKLLTAKLIQVTPIRALLAVSGESWILSEKVSSQQEFTEMKISLRAWIRQLWSSTTPVDQPLPVKEALVLSIKLLQLALDEPLNATSLEMGSDMGLYFAALVLWAITVAATERVKSTTQLAQQAQRHSQSPNPGHPHDSSSVSSTTQQQQRSFPSSARVPDSVPQPRDNILVQSQPASPSYHDPTPAINLLSHEQIISNTKSFLSVVFQLASVEPKNQSSLDLNRFQAGCISLLLWVKLQIRGAPLEDHGSLAVWASRLGEGLGELLESVVGSLERILNRGWTGWGI